jgi:uncharacterized membrane protein YeiH
MSLLNEENKDTSTNEELEKYSGKLFSRVAWFYVLMPIVGAAPGIIAAMSASNDATPYCIFLALVGALIGGVMADILVSFFRLQALRARKLTE